MKNVVKLDNYFAPEELEAALEIIVHVLLKLIHLFQNTRLQEKLNAITEP